jgi:uncharacterized protein YaeQ
LALGSTVYTFDIDLSDVDRGVYQALNLRVAQHPSETPAYLLTRVLAYCLELVEGLTFSKGLSEPDEPALLVRDLTGALQAWIEVGLPEPERLHRASKAAPRVAVYAHKETAQWLARLAEARIHRAAKLEIFVVDPVWLGTLVSRLDRRMAMSLTRAEGEIYLEVGGETLQTVVARAEMG